MIKHRQIQDYSPDFMSELVHTVFTKKLAMIEKADTVKEIKEIEKGSIPHFNGCNFQTGSYHIPEEELILWSLTSLKGPLIPEGQRRFESLFQQVFGVDPVSMSGNELWILNTFPLPPLVLNKLMVADFLGADNGSFLSLSYC